MTFISGRLREVNAPAVTQPAPAQQQQSDEESIERAACHQAQRSVKARLKAPATAEFPACYNSPYRYNVARVGREVVVTGFVDAENSFGAKLRQTFVVTLHSSTDLDAGPRWDRAEVSMPE